MNARTILLALGTVTLIGCDAATDIAGDALEGELRNAATAQCLQVSEGAGIAAARVSEVCDCVAATYIDDPELTLEDVGRERVESIVNDCTAATDPTAGTNQSTPAENAGA